MNLTGILLRNKEGVLMLLHSFLLLAIFTSPLPQESAGQLSVSFKQAQELGDRIWKNECAGKIEGLTSWNEGEDFASLGIGHFIWFPSNTKKKNFQETFPALLTFMIQCGVTPPKGITETEGCPWRNRKHFMNNLESSKMKALRKFLVDTRTLQALFIAKRLEEALPKMTAKLELTEKRRVEKHFYALAKTSKGLYALIDYLNFKGEGTSASENYRGHGWGLLQVLQRIPANTIRPVDDFVASAKELLAERVKNAPHGANEQRWTKGWNARLSTYLQ